METYYNGFKIVTEFNGSGTYKGYYTWVVEGPDGLTTVDIPDEEFQTEEIAIADAKDWIDEFNR